MPSDPQSYVREPSRVFSLSKKRFVSFRQTPSLSLEFFREAILGLRPFQYDLDVSHSAKRIQVVEKFFGFGLACPSSATETEQVLQYVDDLGCGSARLDLCAGQDLDLARGLLEELNTRGVSVLLHLVLTLEDADQLPDQGSLERWRSFLETCCQRLTGLFEAIEVGTTINRVKWSGYDVSGFLAMWEVAHDFCRSAGICLVGPNVTDFEPQYNAGVLGMLSNRGRLPDVQSTNMFSERSIEPEDADHKMLGYRFRHLHGYDLLKKLSLLTAISGKFGLERNWSTSAFWTVPRISRNSGAPEEKMADYLARYFVLCAGHGGFERIFWGPLVSFREGLVDDGTDDRTSSDERDVVAFYSRFPGTVNGWRKRPAFGALRAVAERLAGFEYQGRLDTGAGLEVHRFASVDEVCVVAWTWNKRMAKVRDWLVADSIAQVNRVYSRDGVVLKEAPDFVTESPTYFVWGNRYKPVFEERAKPLSQTVGHTLSKGLSYFNYQTAEWRGLVLATSRDEADCLVAGLNPDVIGACEDGNKLRKSRNAIWTVDDPRDPTRSLVAKKPRTIAWHKRILDRKKPSKARRSWNGAIELMREEIETPAPVALFESVHEGAILENWFICEHSETQLSVREFFSAYASGETAYQGVEFEEFAGQLAVYTRKLHDRGLFFRDLAGGNVMVRLNSAGDFTFSLIDTARIRAFRAGVPRRHRVSDLIRLVNKLDPERRMRFLNLYSNNPSWSVPARERVRFWLYDLKVGLKRYKRHLRRKLRS